MSGFLQVTLIGRAGRDTILKYTPAGVAVADVSIAVTQTWGVGEGKKEKTTWVKVTFWNKLAEIANQYIKKGGLVQVQGESLIASAYTAKDGTLAASLELTASTMLLLGGKREDSNETRSEPPPSREDQLASIGQGAPPIDLSEIPF